MVGVGLFALELSGVAIAGSLLILAIDVLDHLLHADLSLCTYHGIINKSFPQCICEIIPLSRHVLSGAESNVVWGGFHVLL